MAALGYEVEWFDSNSEILQTLFLKFYLEDSTIELLHDKKRSVFLKRIHYPDITPSLLYIGNSVTVFNRLLTIKSYANSATIAYMAKIETHFLFQIPHSIISKVGNVLALGKQFNLIVGRIKSCCKGIVGSLSFENGDAIIELVSLSAVNQDAVISSCESISRSITAAVMTAEEITDIIRSTRTPAVRGRNNTLCLIKPHLLRQARVCDLVNQIFEANFNIKALCTFHLSREMVEELFAVYRGIYINFDAMMTQISCGPCLALLIQGDDENIVNDFREFCGPIEPAIAKSLRPNTLRALFGENLVQNAVHCTDLPEDGNMECRFIFESIANL